MRIALATPSTRRGASSAARPGDTQLWSTYPADRRPPTRRPPRQRAVRPPSPPRPRDARYPALRWRSRARRITGEDAAIVAAGGRVVSYRETAARRTSGRLGAKAQSTRRPGDGAAETGAQARRRRAPAAARPRSPRGSSAGDDAAQATDAPCGEARRAMMLWHDGATAAETRAEAPVRRRGAPGAPGHHLARRTARGASKPQLRHSRNPHAECARRCGTIEEETSPAMGTSTGFGEIAWRWGGRPDAQAPPWREWGCTSRLDARTLRSRAGRSSSTKNSNDLPVAACTKA